MIHLYTGDSAELEECKPGWWLLKHHQKNSCTLLRFYPTREAGEAALAYLAANGTLPPFPEDTPEASAVPF